jgi:hypothetical protein
VVALAVALGIAALPGVAAAKDPCWHAVVQDWFQDGRIDKVYAPSCYEQAMKHLPSDVQYYSDAPNVIRRALQQVLLDRRAATRAATTHAATTHAATTDAATTASLPPTTHAATTQTATQATKTHTVAVAAGGSRGGGGGNGAAPVTPPAKGGGAAPAAPGTHPATSSHANTGPLPEAINQIGPDKASSFPLPLVILAAFAMLLLAAGAAGFAVRRRQTRGLRALPSRSDRDPS